MVPLLLATLALTAACDKVPLLAPTGSVITLIPSALTVSLNSELTIVATVIENGTAAGGSGTSSSRGSGTPVQNGTLITFTTTIGRIEPAEARTHNGSVQVKLITGNESGTPIITAYSGGASTTNDKVKIGTAAVKQVTVAASPATLGSSGGTSIVTATVVNDAGGPLPGVPVTFNTDKGTLSAGSATTDAAGNASTTLTTTQTAKVGASAGTIAAATPVTITVNPFGLTSFTASPNATTTGTPVNFTVTPNSNVSIANVRIEFGDGRTQNLGSISGSTSTSNTYCSAGNYTATAFVTDTAGGTGSLSTGLVIGALPVTLAASPQSPAVGNPVLLLAAGIGSAQVSKYIWTFDDGTGERPTSSPQLTHSFSSKGPKNVRVDVFGVTGCQIGSASIRLEVL